MDLLEVVKRLSLLVIALHGGITLLLPLGWADLALFLNKLEGGNEPVDLIDVSSDAETVLGAVS